MMTIRFCTTTYPAFSLTLAISDDVSAITRLSPTTLAMMFPSGCDSAVASASVIGTVRMMTTMSTTVPPTGAVDFATTRPWRRASSSS